jgi:hypothetical protein
MAEGISIPLRNKILDATFRGVPLPAIASYHTNVLTSVPPATGDCSGLEYAGSARLIVQNNSANWETPSGRATRNINVLKFSVATTRWEPAQGVGLFLDGAATVADFFGAVDGSTALDVSDRYKYNAGQLTLRYDPDGKYTSAEFAHRILGLLRGVTISSPDNLYLGFGEQIPTSDGNIGELSTAGYARYQIPSAAGSWTAPTAGTITNAEIIELAWTATRDTTIRSIGIYENASGGAPLMFAQLTRANLATGKREPAPRDMSTGDSLWFPANQIFFSL